MLMLLADGLLRSISGRIEGYCCQLSNGFPVEVCGTTGLMVFYALNYWKRLPEILRHGYSQAVMQTVWIK